MGISKKNQYNSEAVEWLLKPLRLEAKNGYADTAVLGGLAKWLPRVKEKLVTQALLSESEAERLLAPLNQYALADPPTRAERIQAVFRSLQLDPAAQSGAAARVKKNVKPEAGPVPVPPRPWVQPLAAAPEPWANLDDAVQYFKGVGPQKARQLAKLGIRTVGDLLRHFPREWQDRRALKKIREVKPGELATLCGTVRLRTTYRIRRGLTLTKIVLDDGTGRLDATWFNQPYMRDRFSDGQRVIVHGKVDFYQGWKISNPEFEVLEDEREDLIHTGRIVPVYPLTEGISQRVLRTILYALVTRLPKALPETLPASLLQKKNFPDLASSLAQVHFPTDESALQRARDRLIFEELFMQQLAVVRLRQRYHQAMGTPLRTDGALLKAFQASLPFTLTQAQSASLQQILADLRQSKPMHRLLQGDVGSGKTIVAVLAMLSALDSGLQAALMAPTEVLAAQHCLTLKRLLDPLGVRVELVVSGLAASARREAHEALRSGEIQIAVGTHALTQEKIAFKALGLAVIDEQHRFGVEQRALLRAKGDQPHVLVMTATPIPRTLAMTVYGDLDVATIGELPPGRMPVKTVWLKQAAARQGYAAIEREIAQGRQAYIIFPLIEESEKLDIKSLTREYERLSQHVFPGRRLGLLHGRLSAAEKEEVMAGFKAGRIDILASTTVVEVGVDVPNAAVILIENAERFGLAQLHQLRGRVGRGAHASACFLVADPHTEEGKRRMDIMTRVSNGFRLAEEDLALRGPGEFFGVRQHGLPDLKLANLVRDAAVIEQARIAAEELLSQDPCLDAAVHEALKKAYVLAYGQREEHALTG